MQQRFDIYELEPNAIKVLMEVSNYVSKTSISKTLQELIKIRASQINNCAYCLDMHTKDALKNGETQQRLFLVSAWRETNEIFTEKEKAALAMTDEITLISQKGLSDETYENALKHFSTQEISEIVMAIIIINSWNRIALSSQIVVG